MKPLAPPLLRDQYDPERDTEHATGEALRTATVQLWADLYDRMVAAEKRAERLERALALTRAALDHERGR